DKADFITIHLNKFNFSLTICLCNQLLKTQLIVFYPKAEEAQAFDVVFTARTAGGTAFCIGTAPKPIS
ncbi:MAG: hypothetical protein ACUVSX_09355, partial [Aggregatilineales bacterium]